MISKKIKVKDRYFIEMPIEIARLLSDELEIHLIKEGIVVITNLGGEYEKKVKITEKKEIGKSTRSKSIRPSKLTNEEINVLKKIDKIKFKDRSPEQVDKVITQKEKEILLNLIRKGIVSIYKGKHYAELGGVYSIKNYAYSQVHGKTTSDIQLEKARIPDYVVLDNQYAAKRFSSEYEQLIKSGKLIGIRGFDRKYYIVSRAFFNKYSSRILRSLHKSPMSPEQLSEKFSMPIGACLAVLFLLAERGDVYQSTDKKFHTA